MSDRLTEEAVWAACEALHQQAESPTLENLRAQLGGGSFTTISKYRDTWRKARSEAHAPVAPGSVPETLADPMQKLWAMAHSKAMDNLEELREESRAEVERLEERHLADQAAIAERDRHMEALQGVVNTIEQRIGESVSQLQSLTDAQSHVDQTLQSGQKLQQQVIDATASLRDAQQELTREQSHLTQTITKRLQAIDERMEATSTQIAEKLDEHVQRFEGNVDFFRKQLDAERDQNKAHVEALKSVGHQLQGVDQQLAAQTQAMNQRELESQQAFEGLFRSATTALTGIQEATEGQSNQIVNRLANIEGALAKLASAIEERNKESLSEQDAGSEEETMWQASGVDVVEPYR